MPSLAITAASHTAPAAAPAKLLHAAQQFEAVLLNDLLGPVEKSFSSIPGQETDAGSSNFQYLATQALASHLAGSGGFGIATMIVRNIMRRKQITSPAEATSGVKVSSGKGR